MVILIKNMVKFCWCIFLWTFTFST